ncbi:MAG: SLC13 family permease [Actinomycetota bacterium]|nr:SLC13 family permease [Actinomycetota bacterium]
MAVLSIVALLVGVAGAVGRPFRLPAWAVPVAAAAVVLGAGAISIGSADHALSELSDPLAFLLAAVPLAVLLDRLGFFAAVAGLITARSSSVGGLWILAALVTTVLNLDAAVVLLTPLYVSIARRRGRDPLLLAAQPVLLACLASSALPVSNLTNLIAAAVTGAGTSDFLIHLGMPSLVATAVGWWRYRILLRRSEVTPAALVAPVPSGGGVPEAIGDAQAGDRRRALVVGGIVVVGVLVGFTIGRRANLAPWEVALVGDAALIAVQLGGRRTPHGSLRSLRREAIPWRTILATAIPWRAVPVGTALVAGSLAVLAAAAVVHLRVDQLIGGTSIVALARTTLVAAVGANVVNNLPALLVALPATGHGMTPSLWAVLLGVNMGPVLVVTGSLASLLWLDALHRLGVPVRARDFSRIGAQVGLPAALAGVGTALALAGTGVVA